MKLLVFAHTPPPHHGQSYMVQLMLAGLGGDHRRPGKGIGDGTTIADRDSASRFGVDCYHVDSRLSQKLEDIGDLRIGKLILLLGYCLSAIWCRFRYGVKNFYYIPAPGKRSALYRDWMVMLICRPFFRRIVLHWHAAGLAKWLETTVQARTRSITYRLMKKADMSIVLSKYNRADAEKLFSRQIRVVSNGIPDPCVNFEREVLPRRKARFSIRRKLLERQTPLEAELKLAGESPHVLRVLYLAHCTREKGLFDTIAGVAAANQRLAEWQSPVVMHLSITGNFVTRGEKAEFDSIMAQPGSAEMMEYIGFVAGEQKNKLLRESDVLCFPTYYQNENQPVNLLEAMAFGLPILTSRWRSIPELFPPNYSSLVDVRAPEQVAEGLIGLMTHESGEGFRDIFLRDFTLNSFLSGLADAVRELERPGHREAPATLMRTAS